ncbi:protein of unknown function [Methylocaldum szegediense]|uniref:Uncharacterized protein n=1 Tax=Methylocaldum szegediense TaxID=73780 RepID=A0ABM9HZ99_9GAMM|nr:protein of unknown function [Methylocaldum szegediense]
MWPEDKLASAKMANSFGVLILISDVMVVSYILAVDVDGEPSVQ